MRKQLRTAQPLRAAGFYLTRPVRLFREYDRANLRADLIAGLTVAVILLPQSIALAVVAELPPQMGLYAALVGAFVGGLWGFSGQAHTGPSNAMSLLVFSALVSVAAPDSSQFVIAAGLMAVMAGLFQLLMGVARLGMLVNFVSYSVVVGFSSGAGMLIVIKQLGPLLGLRLQSRPILETLAAVITHLPETHPRTALLGLLTIALILGVRRVNRKLPAALLSLIVSSSLLFLLGWQEQGVRTFEALKGGLPPLAPLPYLDLGFIGRLSTGALAVGAIGLVITSSIARSFASQTGQRLDNDQEFVGQGLANILSGMFSGFPVAASFSRSAVNLAAGSKTSVGSVISAVFLFIISFALAPLAAYLPRTALAGVLIVAGVGMIDRKEIGRTARGAPSDALIMVVTLLGTLLLPMEFAVLLGILLSFALYIRKTAVPQVQFVLPDEAYRHFVPHLEEEACPQLGVMEVRGDLYFGAISHVEEMLLEHMERHPDERFLLVRMHTVNQADISGIHLLETVTRMYRERGGDVFLVRVSEAVRLAMEQAQFDVFLGPGHILGEDEAISWLFYHVLDPAVCIYECPVRAFGECQNLPKYAFPQTIPLESAVPQGAVPEIRATDLHQLLVSPNGDKPLLVDVREPREFRRGHIPQAVLRPLSALLTSEATLPADGPIVLVCRTGRRSRRAAYLLQQQGYGDIAILQGGILAWENAGLLEAVETVPPSPGPD